jgi:glycosyltransferase involved in cell wall biosynthesis
MKQVVPNVRIYMTLHEYMAICRNNGQMVKVGGLNLCNSESFDECRQCFPQNTREDFWLRKHYFQAYFKCVDGFVAPSEFLRQRYIQWGLKPERIVVIENGHSDDPLLPPRDLREGETRNRFAFFGQINPYKGIDLLLEALHAMPKKERRQVVVEIHGANLEHQHGELQDRIRRLSEPLIKKHHLRWVGPYRPSELRNRMDGADWVLVPSVWWENSPMVIQEAFVCGRPVISSDIGGMAEKVTHGVDGLHVRTGNAMHWGETLYEAATTAGLWDRLRAGIKRPITVAECVNAHLEAFPGLSG